MKKLVTSDVVKYEINQDGKELFWFKVTSEALDRQNEIVKSNSYDINKFMENPVMFFQHNSYSLPIGLWIDYKIENKSLYLAGWFHEKTDELGNELSKTIKDYVKDGIIKATSIGFRAKQSHTERVENRNVLIYDEIDLIEVSVVTIGANPEALAKMKNYIGEEMDIEVKAGSVLSKANKENLINAMESIKKVLESAGKDEPENDTAKDYDIELTNLETKINSLSEINEKLLNEINDLKEIILPKKIKFNEIG